jgi:hypothetical protein
MVIIIPPMMVNPMVGLFSSSLIHLLLPPEPAGMFAFTNAMAFPS